MNMPGRWTQVLPCTSEFGTLLKACTIQWHTIDVSILLVKSIAQILADSWFLSVVAIACMMFYAIVSISRRIFPSMCINSLILLVKCPIAYSITHVLCELNRRRQQVSPPVLRHYGLYTENFTGRWNRRALSGHQCQIVCWQATANNVEIDDGNLLRNWLYVSIFRTLPCKTIHYCRC